MLRVREGIATMRYLTWGYLSESMRALTKHAKSVTLGDLIRFYPGWVRSNVWTRGSLSDKQPWLPYNATRFLSETLHDGARVFEYGAGGSSLFFASRGAARVTVEHDREWLERTSREMERMGATRWRCHLVLP